MAAKGWKVYNPSGKRRVVVTKELPGDRWLKILAQADVRVEYGTETRILKVSEIKAAVGSRCDGAIGQLTEAWGNTLFAALRKAGGTVYSNYAVGYNNVDVDAATKRGIPVGNTPGVLTETTAEMAVGLISLAEQMVDSGASMLLIEGTAAEVTEIITSRCEVPVIGIGAGPNCDGQILIAPDVLGLIQGPCPKFSKSYDNLAERTVKAFAAFNSEVENQQYPDAEHSYHMKSGELARLHELAKGQL